MLSPTTTASPPQVSLGQRHCVSMTSSLFLSKSLAIIAPGIRSPRFASLRTQWTVSEHQEMPSCWHAQHTNRTTA